MEKQGYHITEEDVADAIIERPHGFSVEGRHFYLYPATLGKIYLLQRLVRSLEIDHEIMRLNPYLEALRLVETKREDCCLLLTYQTLKSKSEMFDNIKIKIRRDFFVKHLANDDLATLIIITLTHTDQTDQIEKFLGIEMEMARMNKVMKVKDDKNTFSFGGVSIYGSLIAAACEKFHWTMDYVMWGITFTNLQLLMRDSVKTVYLSDEERKKAHISNDRTRIDGNDKDLMRAFVKSRNWN